MKKKEKRRILILVIITIIAIILLYFQKRPKDENQETAQEQEFITVQEYGSKIATSEKLQEKRKIGEIEIDNINIREENGLAKITASATNVGEQKTEEMPITIVLKDEAGNSIAEIGAYIGTIEKGEQRGIQGSANVTIDEVYDVEISLAR